MELEDDSELAINLSHEERQRLRQPTNLTQHQRDKLELEAKKSWDLFYKRNGDRFFKPRFWTRSEFPELFHRTEASGGLELRYLLEIGCGCGDLILPLLENTSMPKRTELDDGSCAETGFSITHDGRTNEKQALADDLFIYFCDISDVAIEILKDKSTYKKFYPQRVKAFQANVITDHEKLIEQVDIAKGLDYVSLVFVLSSLEPVNMPAVLDIAYKLLKPGGVVLFRDYAIYDKAMMRFDEKSKIDNRFYVRQDGTRAYFFTKQEILNLFTANNLFSCQSIEYVRRETLNNATKDRHSRIFLQAKFLSMKESLCRSINRT